MTATPLEAIVRRQIAETGPISVAEFMALALGHPEHGYYRNKQVIGAAGDFITAPEISQMFGELIGAWALDLWQRDGARPPFRLVECGPGRGTLMADMARTAGLVPAARAALDIHLVEINAVLRAEQERSLARSGMTATWHEAPDTLPPGPAILVANEFLDALPVRQFVRKAGRWHEVMVAIDGHRLAFAPSPLPADPALLPATATCPGEDAVVEISPATEATAAKLAGHVAGHGGAALLIDYGHTESGTGDTLQAVAGHRRADPLERPGEIDLTAHVDFSAVARSARDAGATVHGPVTQGTFLARLGLRQRAEVLKRKGDAAAIDIAVERLAGADAMGNLFKVVAFSPKDGPVPAGFS